MGRGKAGGEGRSVLEEGAALAKAHIEREKGQGLKASWSVHEMGFLVVVECGIAASHRN